MPGKGGAADRQADDARHSSFCRVVAVGALLGTFLRAIAGNPAAPPPRAYPCVLVSVSWAPRPLSPGERGHLHNARHCGAKHGRLPLSWDERGASAASGVCAGGGVTGR